MDADGVALAAVQGLDAQVQHPAAQLAALTDRLDQNATAGGGGSGGGWSPFGAGWPSSAGWVGLGVVLLVGLLAGRRSRPARLAAG